MLKLHSGIRMLSNGLMLSAFCFITVLAVVSGRPAQAQVQWNHDVPPPQCGMVVTPTGDEFWPCPAGQTNPHQAPLLPDDWGAVAVSPSTPLWGSSWNFKSKEEAAADALKRCKNSGKSANDCKVVLKVADVCTALAMSTPEKIYRTGGPTGATNFASGNAMLQCQRAGGRSCAIAISFCADGVNHVLNGTTVFSKWESHSRSPGANHRSGPEMSDLLVNGFAIQSLSG